MKKAFIFAAFMMFIAGAAYAGFPYVGLYAGIIDGDTELEGAGGSDHSACSVFVPAYTEINMWIWWLPDPSKGLNTVEFKIVFPATSIVGVEGVTPNPLVLAEIGTLGAGIASTVGELQCQYGWYWSHQQMLLVKKTTASTITIVMDPLLANPPYDVIIASCELGSPSYACTKLNNLGVNSSCIVAVQDKSWGAIKSLYNE
jgi:hypothetical protein